MSAHKRALLTPDSNALRRLDELAAELRKKSQMNLRGSPAEQRAAARGDTGRANGLLSQPDVTLEDAPMSLELQLEDRECALIRAHYKLLDERDKVSALEAELAAARAELKDKARMSEMLIEAGKWAVAKSREAARLAAENQVLRAENQALLERLTAAGILVVDAPEYDDELLAGDEELVRVGEQLLAQFK